MSILTMLADHNEWANRRIFAAAVAVPEPRLNEETDGYDSVIGILRHLVQDALCSRPLIITPAERANILGSA